MSYDKSVSDHYLHGDLLNAIKATLPELGKTTETITIEDLAPVDEFHIGGRAATDHLIYQMVFAEHNQILDIGCGLGGAARHIANHYKCHVTGIDLTPEYIDTGNILSTWLNLDDSVILKQGSALSMPFQDKQFDGAYMLHVGMNIDDKKLLFSEIHRVLKPGASFGIYDIMLQNNDALIYPVPWATESSTSMLATADEYKQALNDAGFKIVQENNRRDFALAFFKQLRATTKANGGPPPLGLHTLMQGSAATKVKNMANNIVNGCIAPVEIIAYK